MFNKQDNKQGNNFKCSLKNLKKARAIWETVTLCSFADSVGLALEAPKKNIFWSSIEERNQSQSHATIKQSSIHSLDHWIKW